MKPLLILFAFIFLPGKSNGQHHPIDIPELKSIDPKDKYPERSILATYTTNFDLLISLKNYSSWGPDEHIEVLAHHESGWYKIEIITDHKNFGTFEAVCLLLSKIDNAVGDCLWNVLRENHLFDMKDDRMQKISCARKIDTLITDGKPEVVERFMIIDDGSEYEFEILTRSNYKKLYFYEPGEYYDFYNGPIERKWIANCITAFEKYLGK